MAVQVTKQMLDDFVRDARGTGENIVAELKKTVISIQTQLPEGYKGRAYDAYIGVQDDIDRAMVHLFNDLDDAALAVETHGTNLDDTDIEDARLLSDTTSTIKAALLAG
ncbi:WXG100 family type VII secretion target [Dactylosporangium sp. AC04546]|uniref:WXG100 family type VII secretion target n=1 Tax=Dactylosporangium sp. AC04546 TaxID=2862460 RepID=UPI001EDD4B5D|nr:WXG100 family type VII secretion target [Dactylosporangium sp. AC04546]WVK89088.1 WXG100 family type VII secretion target [Dactylosporangium sp. AC04546]